MVAAVASSSSSGANPAAGISGGMDASQVNAISRQLIRQLSNSEAGLRGKLEDVKQNVKCMVVSVVHMYKFYSQLPQKDAQRHRDAR